MDRRRIIPENEHDTLGKLRATRNQEDIILGEMGCMNHYPRSATVVARTPGSVYEIRRNVLYTLQRNAASRKVLDQVYRERALRETLVTCSFFAELSDHDIGRFEVAMHDVLRVRVGQRLADLLEDSQPTG